MAYDKFVVTIRTKHKWLYMPMLYICYPFGWMEAWKKFFLRFCLEIK